MKKTLMLIACLFLSLAVYCQDYKKDMRTQHQKEDSQNQFHADRISNVDLIKALELAGIRIHKFRLGEFDKAYNFEIVVEEYLNGEVVDRKSILQYNNTYMHFDDTIPYIDYIDQITFYSKKDKDHISVEVSTYALTTRSKLKERVLSENQFYSWRSYSQTNWKLNQSIPLLVYASSWYDERFDIQRFCGTVDLSRDKEDTKELLESSPHYFLINYKVSE